MDWFTWLSRTSLDPSLIYDYGLAFVHNELEQEDLAHFTHDFLQSMGINTAKHRLEILKLAYKERNRIPDRVFRLVLKFKKSINKCVGKYVLQRRRLAHQDSRLSLVGSSERCSSSRWKSVMMKRSNAKCQIVFCQNSIHHHDICGHDSRIHSFSSPEVENENVGRQDFDDYWSSATRVVADDGFRWDAMFGNLKPT